MFQRLLGISAVLACAGCALEPGHPYGRLAASIESEYEIPQDRRVTGEDGWARLNTDYLVRVTAFSVHPHHVLFQGSRAAPDSGAGDAAGGAFDPSNPPEGYSLCHGGHCHRDDGALVPYEEISAGGGDAAAIEVELEAPSLDVLAAERAALDCDERCSLPRGQLTQAVLELGEVSFEAEVRDALQPPRFPGTVPLRFAVAFEEEAPEGFGVASVPLSIELGDEDETTEAEVTLHISTGPSLLDDLDLAPLALSPEAQGVILLNASTNVTHAQSLWRRLQSSVRADVSRN